MELRWLKGNWDFGKFKLQMKQPYMANWQDVPTVLNKDTATVTPHPKGCECSICCFPMERNAVNKVSLSKKNDYDLDGPRDFPCSHIEHAKLSVCPSKCKHIKFENSSISSKPHLYFIDTGEIERCIDFIDHWKFCPICGTPRPVRKTLREELVEKFQKEGWDQVLTECSAKELADIAIKTMNEYREG